MEKNYWDYFYSSKVAPIVPSQFCVMVAQDIEPNSNIIDFGCGNGRDLNYFSILGHNVIGIDASEKAIEFCSSKKLPNTKFVNKNVFSLNLEDLKFSISSKKVIIYSRFFQHTLEPAEQSFMFELLKQLAKYHNLKCYFEFRNNHDKDNRHIFEDHYRRYQSEAEFIGSLNSSGFSVEYFVSGNGMSYFKGEDPDLTRVIAVRR
jgi:SAM-dependent methyltransferase